MTALVLSAGGMFGAYQAGAWKALAGRVRPDIVIGASVGSLNGWAIAGGAGPDELVASWLDPGCSRLAVFRAFQAPWRGCFDSQPLHARIRNLWAEYAPKTRVEVVATEIPALRTRVFPGECVTWRHLAASCAVMLAYEQVRIDGRLYTDGGLLGALPLRTAAESGADRIIAINALPALPSRAVSVFVRAVQALAPRPPAAPGPAPRVRVIAPRGPLGPLREAVFWNGAAVERWIAAGEADALRADLE